MRGLKSGRGSSVFRILAPFRGKSTTAATPTNKEEVVEVEKKGLKEIPKVATPATVYRPPYYRRAHQHHKPAHMLQEEYQNASDASGTGIRLFDYFKTAEIVNSLPTIKEKIDFVSPYERPWTRSEQTWRRAWQPTLIATRKAWEVPPVPAHIDALNFYQYITKTRVANKSLDEFYEGIVPPLAQFKALLKESFSSLNTSPFDWTEEECQSGLGMVIDDAMMSLAHNVRRLSDYRVAYNVPVESFWIRSGFMFLYDEQDIETRQKIRRLHNVAKFIGDDRRKLGELAFVHRDKFAAQLRAREQLAPLHSLDSEFAMTPIFDDKVDLEDVLFSPKVYNLWPDENPLWQCPGYHSDSAEIRSYQVLATKSIRELRSNVEHWTPMEAPQSKIRKELFDRNVCAQAVVSLFSNLCAEAHTHGFTQYTDVTRPFSSQLMLSDGSQVYFAVGQLNTLAINIDCEVLHNKRTNYVQIEGPFPMYVMDGNTVELELNEIVLERVLQMLMK